MGGSRDLLFKSGQELDRCMAFLEPVSGSIVAGDADCWPHRASSQKLEVQISFGNLQGNDILATLVCREIARRFGCRRYGSDATGWYDERDVGKDLFIKERGRHESWVAWLMSADAEALAGAWTTSPFSRRRVVRQAKEIEEVVVRIFERLDGVAGRAQLAQAVMKSAGKEAE